MDISWWYCCLNVRERTILLNTCEGLAVTLFVGIPLPVWDAFWIATGYTASFYKEQFRGCFQLEIATIDADGEPIEVVRPRAASTLLWVLWCAFVVTPSAACLDGCQQSHVP